MSTVAVAPGDPRPLVAVVLPGGEWFSPQVVGAIGLIVHRLTGAPSAFRHVILGAARTPASFEDRVFIPVRAWPFASLAERARYPAAVLRALRRLRPALVEVHNRPNLALFLAARMAGTKVVLVVHNDPQSMRRARTRLNGPLCCTGLPASSAYRTGCTERLMEAVVVNPASARAVVVPNCIDIGALPPALPPDARAPVILFAGRTIVEKGADLFVRACAAALPDLPGWQAVMLGARGHSPLDDAIGYDAPGPTASKSGIRVFGYQPHPVVLDWMGRAAIVLMPSRWQEPFGLTALEALAMGATLMCSRVGGLPEVAGEAAVYVDPGNPDAIAAALVALARDPARRADLAAQGRARAAQFDLAAAGQALDVFRWQVIGSGLAGA